MAKKVPAKIQNLLHVNYQKESVFSTYLRFYRNDKLKLFYALILFVVKASPVWVIPIITADMINLFSDKSPNATARLTLEFVIGLLFIVQNIPTHVWFVRVFSLVSRKVEMELRSALCTRLQHLSIPYHTNNKLGTLQTKVLRDVETIENLTRMLVDTIPSIVIGLSVAVIVTLIRAPLFVLFYLGTVPIAVAICKVLGGKMQEYNKEFRVSVESMSGKVIEMLRLITVTRAHNSENDELNRVNAKLEEVKERGLRLDYLNAIFGSVNWVCFMIFNICALYTAVLMSRSGLIDVGVGDVVLLSTYFGSITGTVLTLMNTVPAITKGLESVRSIGEVLECPDIEKNENKPELHALKGNFNFDHVSFSYDKSDKHAVSDFSLKVKSGETIALVGPSGSGKSTLMQLLIGFIRPSSGKIEIDGYDMNSIDLRSYRKFISVVSQESILFDGTIRDNIMYGSKNISEAQLKSAVQSANLEEFINSLPQGLDTPIKENGGRLSGGQKQRLAIARALLRDPQVLLLDEATSALDVESEALIQEALERLIKGRTSFIVAHRLSTIRNADRIVVMRNGAIAEIGTHDELLKKQGIYYRMTLLQSHDITAKEAVDIGLELERK